MLSELFKMLEAIHPLSPQIKQQIVADLEIFELPAHKLILREGECCDYLYVVFKGLLRAYYIKDGEEVCSRFMAEGHISASVYSFFTRKPGYEFMEALEPGLLGRIHHDKLEQLYLKFPEFNFVGRVVTEQYFVAAEERQMILRKTSARERYDHFVNTCTEYHLRVPLTYIASYLGMNLETLSRVRKKISLGQ